MTSISTIGLSQGTAGMLARSVVGHAGAPFAAGRRLTGGKIPRAIADPPAAAASGGQAGGSAGSGAGGGAAGGSSSAASSSGPSSPPEAAVQIEYRGRRLQAQRGATLRTAMLEAGVTPHNGRATLINCRGLGSCGTCAVEVRGPVEPAGWTAQERLRLNFPPHGPPGNARLRLACQVACQGDLAVVKRTQFWGQGEEVVPDFPDATAGAAGTAGTAGTAAAAEVMPLGQLEFVLDRRRQRG